MLFSAFTDTECKGGQFWPPVHGSLSLVIDLTDASQVVTAGYGVNTDDEVDIAARSLESARASDEAEESLIDSRKWIQDSVNLKLKLISVGSRKRCVSARM